MSIENLAIKDQCYKFATYETVCHTKNRLQITLRYFFPLFLFTYLVVCIFVLSCQLLVYLLDFQNGETGMKTVTKKEDWKLGMENEPNKV